jgi:LacI family transcriptional regulator
VRVGELATGHLLELGRRRIATVTGRTSRHAVRDLLRGYQRALRSAGLKLDASLVEHADWEIDGGYRATLRLLDRAPDLDAIFVHNDTMAIGVLSALQERRRRVPDECAVVGCDDIPAAAHTIPRLSTIRIPFFDLGEAAMRLLLDAVSDPTPEVRRIDLPVALVCRATCGCGGKSGQPRAVVASRITPSRSATRAE